MVRVSVRVTVNARSRVWFCVMCSVRVRAVAKPRSSVSARLWLRLGLGLGLGLGISLGLRLGLLLELGLG